ncbi:LOB domain-containing protein 41 [Spatholobus suberectus]|nr:LOB domain-containing protein 41 [Spatholobus suberectus]
MITVWLIPFRVFPKHVTSCYISITTTMRLSCNGCRVLRRGCTPECPIRTSLQWINSPHSQSNATLFLAKFYGRQGLLNLLTAAPSQLQPAVFKSLLYEACGRIVNPVFGSTGLLSTGNWHLCEAAAKAVLSGAPIQQAPLDGAVSLQLEACDIRHVAKSGKSCGSDALLGVKSRTSKFKRRAAKPKGESAAAELAGSELDGSVSRDSGSGVTRASENKIVGGEADSSSGESVEPAPDDGEEIELQLTLGWGAVKRPTVMITPRVGLDLSG